MSSTDVIRRATALLLPLLFFHECNGAILLDRSMRTIGGAMKGVSVPANTEFELFAFAEGTAGVITEQWYSIFGGAHPYDPGPDPIIRIYYDGFAAPPSLQYRLFMAHGLGPYGCSDYAGQRNCTDPAVREATPADPNGFANTNGGSWGSELLGHGSARGALKNTYRVPFGAAHGIRITMELPFDSIAYFYCRGMTNYPVIVGDVQLPPGARLRLHTNEAVAVAPHEFLPLVPRLGPPAGPASAGLLLQVTLAANSSFIGFMEGCVRARIDDNATAAGAPATNGLPLSSGTEDYFEGANFFDTGLMQSAAAGVTWVAGENPGPYYMTAYKHHVRDPVVWWESFELTARNYDSNGVQCGGGSTTAGASTTATAAPRASIKAGGSVELQTVTMSSYAWYYEW